jgi:hypothetical protein
MVFRTSLLVKVAKKDATVKNKTAPQPAVVGSLMKDALPFTGRAPEGLHLKICIIAHILQAMKGK